MLVNITDCSPLLASPVLPKFKLLTLATSGDGDPATVVGEDDRLTLQMLSAARRAHHAHGVEYRYGALLGAKCHI